MERQLHLCFVWPTVFRVASVYYNAFFGKPYGMFHTTFQMFVTALILTYSLVAAVVLDQVRGPILPCSWLPDGNCSELTNSTAVLDPVCSARTLEEDLAQFCQKAQMMQAWICIMCM